MQRIGSSVASALALNLALIVTAVAEDAPPTLAQGRDIVELPGMGRVIFVFLLVAGLAVAAAHVLRRYSPNFARGLMQQQGPIRVIGRATLNAGLRVHLIEVHGERLLIAENRTGLSLLQLRGPEPSGTKNESP